MNSEPKYLIVVKVARGLKVMDTPRPESQGGRVMRAEPVGKILYALGIHNISGVDYARLVPQNPVKPEWVRVAEADDSIEYVDVIELDGGSGDPMVAAINHLADAILKLVSSR